MSLLAENSCPGECPHSCGAYRTAQGKGARSLRARQLTSVHSNSGIVNAAHVLLAGSPGTGSAPPIAGIGRAKLETFAFLVMTTRLTPWSRLVDSAIATHDMARTLLLRGATATRGGAAFVQSDVDQVPLAIGMVGLSPSYSTRWSEPTLGFFGTDTLLAAGETTENGCTITNVQTPMGAPTGQLMADLSPLTGEPSSVNFFGIWGIGFSPLPAPRVALPPIGGTAKTHSIFWFNIFGRKPGFYTTVVAPPPFGSVDCITPVGSTPRPAHLAHHGQLDGGVRQEGRRRGGQPGQHDEPGPAA